MKRPEGRLFTACLATTIAALGSPVGAAAEGAVPTQDLLNVRSAGQVTASWTRQPDYYALQVVMETARPGGPKAVRTDNLNGEEMRQLGIAHAEEQLRKLTPPNVSPERSSFFAGTTIANLRGLDPVFGCRTLTLVDGRRVLVDGGRRAVSGQAAAPYPSGVVQTFPPAIKHPRIEAWLLKADGTQVVPAAYTCTVLPAMPEASGASTSVSRNKSDEFSYRYPIEDGAQAVAVAIRIDNDFYIEKVQPLDSGPSGQ